MRQILFFLIIFPLAFGWWGCPRERISDAPEEEIKAYDLDFNWGEGGPNAFAAPGLWADASPEAHIKWYKELGVNTIQTFIVSCNGYAWYKNGVVPPQPGLKHDFLPEMVKLGHQEGMKVMGYLCIGSNTRWGQENPDYSYGFPADRHIPYTRKYLDYLDGIIRDAVAKTDIDGFMIDWFYQPNRNSTGGKWLASEKQRYQELMNEPFPGEDQLTDEDYNTYSRRAIAACWEVIRTAAKETNPDCIIWLTCFDITHPHIVDSKMFQEIDWLMNEAGDLSSIDSVRSMVGPDTRLITCLADWNKMDAKEVAVNAKEAGIGLYGFTKPQANSLMPSAGHYLSAPIDSFRGDDRNIATLARVYNNLPMDYVVKFNSSWQSLEHYRCPDWFRDAKFGIFVCWNPHSVAAKDDWYARNMYIQGHESYKYHIENFGHPSEVGYKDIIEMWKGENFHPDRLVRIYKDAGAKYIVPLAVYHDNFDLWNSIHHEWNSVNHGPKKDVIGMWRDAIMKHGLRFGVTTHLARSWSWFQTSHGADTSGPYEGIPYDGRNPEYQDLYFETHENTSLSYPQDPPDYWPEQWYTRIKDLVDQYQPDLLYFDGGIPFGETGRKMIAYFYNSNIEKHNGELQAVMNIKNNTARPVGNNRFMPWHGDYREGIAVEDIERGQKSKIGQVPWQTDDSVGPWFWMNNSSYKSPAYIIHQLIDIVSKNGNLLLNVPLRSDGSLDEEATDLLRKVGKWMSVNGEGIYGTRPFIHFNGLPTWYPDDDFTNIDKATADNLRFTTRGDTIFVFTGDIPDKEVLIRSLNRAIYPEFTSVEMLGVDSALKFVQDNEALKVKMPDVYPCDYSVCLKIY